MPRRRSLIPVLVVLGGLAGAGPAQADVTGFTLTPATPQAASHQDVTFGVDLDGTNQAVRVDLPPGLLGNAASVPRCAEAAFQAGTCAADTQVGTSTSQATATALDIPIPASGTISNLEPGSGEAARLGVTLTPTPNLTGAIRVEVPVTLQGDFSLRSTIQLPQTAGGLPVTVTSLSTTLSGTAGNGAPFATLPPTCSPLTGSAAASEDGTTYGDARTDTIEPTGCGAVPFTPTVAFATSTRAAGASTGVTVTLTQPAGEATQAQSPIASSTVTLPTGLGLDFAKVGGLLAKACPSLDAAAAGSCEAARMGSVAVDTPAAGALTGSAYFTTAAPGADGPTTGIFLVARDRPVPDTAVTLRLSATTTPTSPVVTVLNGLPPTLATRFELVFDPLFTNPCTPTAQGSAQLTSASGPTASPTASITTTGTCATTPPATTPATPTTPATTPTTPTTTETTPTTTSTTPTATIATTTATVPVVPPQTAPTPALPTTSPSRPRARLRVSLRRLGGRRVQVRTLVLAGPARCDGSLRVTVNRGARGLRLARTTTKLPSSCLVRTTLRLPRAAAGRRVSAQVALRDASQLQDATVRTRTARIRRG